MHGVDEAVDKRVREMARKNGTSINKTLQALLRRALGLDVRADHRADFADVAGRWSQADVDEFEAATAELSKVDAEDWK